MAPLGARGFTVLSSIAFLVNNQQSASQLHLGLAYRVLGWVNPTACLVFIAVIAGFACLYLAKAISALPNNKRFRFRVEFSRLAFRLFPSWAAAAISFMVIADLIATSVHHVVHYSRLLDLSSLHFFGKACALSISPAIGGICVDSRANAANHTMWTAAAMLAETPQPPTPDSPGEAELRPPFADSNVVFSAGLLVASLLALPVSLVRLSDTLWLQVGGAVARQLILLVFYCQFVALGVEQDNNPADTSVPAPVPAYPSPKPFFPSDLLALCAVLYDFVVTCPSWLNERDPRLAQKSNAKKFTSSLPFAIWTAIGISTVNYVLLGALAARALPTTPRGEDDILGLIFVRPTRYWRITYVCCVLFGIVNILTSLPQFIIIARYNLLQLRWRFLPPWLCKALPVVLVLLLSVTGYDAFTIDMVMAWLAAIFSAPINLAFPLVVYLVLRNNGADRYGDLPLDMASEDIARRVDDDGAGRGLIARCAACLSCCSTALASCAADICCCCCSGGSASGSASGSRRRGVGRNARPDKHGIVYGEDGQGYLLPTSSGALLDGDGDDDDDDDDEGEDEDYEAKLARMLAGETVYPAASITGDVSLSRGGSSISTRGGGDAAGNYAGTSSIGGMELNTEDGNGSGNKADDNRGGRKSKSPGKGSSKGPSAGGDDGGDEEEEDEEEEDEGDRSRSGTAAGGPGGGDHHHLDRPRRSTVSTIGFLLPSWIMPLARTPSQGNFIKDFFNPRSPIPSTGTGTALTHQETRSGSGSSPGLAPHYYSTATSNAVVVPSGNLPRGSSSHNTFGRSKSSRAPTMTMMAHGGGGGGGGAGGLIEMQTTSPRQAQPGGTTAPAPATVTTASGESAGGREDRFSSGVSTNTAGATTNNNIFLAIAGSSADLETAAFLRQEQQAAAAAAKVLASSASSSSSASSPSAATSSSAFGGGAVPSSTAISSHDSSAGDRSESTDAVRSGGNHRGGRRVDHHPGYSDSTLDRASAARDLSTYTNNADGEPLYGYDDDKSDAGNNGDDAAERPRRNRGYSLSAAVAVAASSHYRPLQAQASPGAGASAEEAATLEARDRALGRYCHCLCRRRVHRLSTQLPRSAEEVVVVLPNWVRQRLCSEQLFASLLLFVAVLISVVSVVMQILLAAGDKNPFKG